MSTIVLTSCFGFVNFVNADTPLFFEVAEGIGNFGAYVSNQIIVKFKEEISDDVISRINSKYGTFVKSVIFNSKLVSLEIPAGKSVFDMLQIYNNDPNVVLIPLVNIKSLMDVGTPFNKPSFSPFFTLLSASFAFSLAISNVVVQ